MPLGAAEGAGEGRGRHREAPISTLVVLIEVGWRSQGSPAISGGDIRQCSKKGNPFILREVCTPRSYTQQITETHASMKFNF